MKRFLVSGALKVAIVILLLGATAAVEQDSRAIDAMSDRERIGQMLFLGLSGPIANAEMRKEVSEWHVSGIALYAHNVESREQVRRLNEEIVHASGDTNIAPLDALNRHAGFGGAIYSRAGSRCFPPPKLLHLPVPLFSLHCGVVAVDQGCEDSKSRRAEIHRRFRRVLAGSS